MEKTQKNTIQFDHPNLRFYPRAPKKHLILLKRYFPLNIVCLSNCEIIMIESYNLSVGPLPVTVANEGLVRDSILNMWQNPGGHWHPGRGE